MSAKSSPLVPIRELQAALACSRPFAVKLVREGTVSGKQVGKLWFVHRSAIDSLTEVN